MQEKTKLAIAGGILAVTAIFPLQALAGADSEATGTGTVTSTSLIEAKDVRLVTTY